MQGYLALESKEAAKLLCSNRGVFTCGAARVGKSLIFKFGTLREEGADLQ